MCLVVTAASKKPADRDYETNACHILPSMLQKEGPRVAFGDNACDVLPFVLQKEGPRVAFRDNDSLAALLAIELKADLLVLLTDVNGLFDGPPADPKSNFIPTYCPEVHDELIKFGDPSQGGRGGMVSKVHMYLCMSACHSASGQGFACQR